jgi:hypothetical protein
MLRHGVQDDDSLLLNIGVYMWSELAVADWDLLGDVT